MLLWLLVITAINSRLGLNRVWLRPNPVSSASNCIIYTTSRPLLWPPLVSGLSYPATRNSCLASGVRREVSFFPAFFIEPCSLCSNVGSNTISPLQARARARRSAAGACGVFSGALLLSVEGELVGVAGPVGLRGTRVTSAIEGLRSGQSDLPVEPQQARPLVIISSVILLVAHATNYEYVSSANSRSSSVRRCLPTCPGLWRCLRVLVWYVRSHI